MGSKYGELLGMVIFRDGTEYRIYKKNKKYLQVEFATSPFGVIKWEDTKYNEILSFFTIPFRKQYIIYSNIPQLKINKLDTIKSSRDFVSGILPDKDMFPLPPVPKLLSDAMKKKSKK